jgi:OPT oligopeptide transporter protein
VPVLTGVSIFCLTKRDSMLYTHLFGGSNGNEGLGLFSFCFDWQYISGAPMWLPLQTLTNNFVGYILCIAIYMYVCVFTQIETKLTGLGVFSMGTSGSPRASHFSLSYSSPKRQMEPIMSNSTRVRFSIKTIWSMMLSWAGKDCLISLEHL